ncbi:similar to Saccharomyces cerevisiae YLR033W RSC58 Component of the RSC chromatin remodeling complex [Maudiozyma barnettii]|uniref:Similar to Saccharomyces cerevisiae YLR033W RSC58 Component of the RSC chromatin remodeling complex n=1 Tax=Maudiozyma barnettii TaxID=61262 RepID=A0A8H2ZMH8_9SACH|nr:Rsc58p [Kazachstania barnettii]CAB4257107.1 similar to Saccharomyces cerevisiae YLR033W RSC58 Component of the RSC chromatin remodeling complex [Kazachstania barnettii]CAD1779477.1 similar to Saccharomyces cerevisiae YLR033W RSC58 Component of the RSC chromatin remodeling complex [Kazachstania barnettii]
MSANELLDNLQVILKAASTKCFVVDEKFPSKFIETNPSKIYHSYVKFMTKHVAEDGVSIKDEETLELTTISQKFDEHAYKVEKNGFYKLYHDITLVCLNLINFYAPGSRFYQMVDKFYRFATELLLRECYKIGVQLTSIEDNIEKEVEEEEDDNLEKNELSEAISLDFIKISTCYKLPTTQTYHIKTKDHDLFSSIISKSILDHRPQELPNSHFEINNIIPQTNLFEEAPRLGFIAANTSNIPDPTLPPTEMMSRFLHPNWYALPTTTWLSYGDYKSWAPPFDENGTVMDSTTRGEIWLKKLGYNEIINEKAKGEENEKCITTSELEEKDETLKLEDNKTNDSTEESDETDTTKIQETDNGSTETEKPVIKLENIYKWQPGNYIEKDEIECFENGTEDQLINEILSKIQGLRKIRIKKKISKPTNEESKLYYKAKRLLKEIVINKEITNLPRNHVRYMPVLQANYNGSIPVVRAQPTRRRKYKK